MGKPWTIASRIVTSGLERKCDGAHARVEDNLWEVHDEDDVAAALAPHRAVRESLRAEKNKRGYHKGQRQE
eukprot:1699686-Pyramimonas_sp.AAC.1